MLPVVSWRIYYGDRSIFSSTDGDWVDAPFLNVAALAIPEPGVIRQIITGDYYVLWNKTPHSPEFAGLLDYLYHETGFRGSLDELSLHDLETAGVKLGRMYDNDVWRELWPWVVADADQTWGDR